MRGYIAVAVCFPGVTGIIRNDAVLKSGRDSALVVNASSKSAESAIGSMVDCGVQADGAVVDHGCAIFMGEAAAKGRPGWPMIRRLIPAEGAVGDRQPPSVVDTGPGWAVAYPESRYVICIDCALGNRQRPAVVDPAAQTAQGVDKVIRTVSADSRLGHCQRPGVINPASAVRTAASAHGRAGKCQGPGVIDAATAVSKAGAIADRQLRKIDVRAGRSNRDYSSFAASINDCCRSRGTDNRQAQGNAEILVIGCGGNEN